MTPEMRFLEWLVTDCGYCFVKVIGGGRYVAIVRYGFTHAIIVGRIGDMTGFDDRWCYHDRAGAEDAMDAWDCTGEPEGWHRHPGSGRRRCEGPGEYDDDHNEVPIGATYVRR